MEIGNVRMQFISRYSISHNISIGLYWRNELFISEFVCAFSTICSTHLPCGIHTHTRIVIINDVKFRIEREMVMPALASSECSSTMEPGFPGILLNDSTLFDVQNGIVYSLYTLFPLLFSN